MTTVIDAAIDVVVTVTMKITPTMGFVVIMELAVTVGFTVTTEVAMTVTPKVNMTTKFNVNGWLAMIIDFLCQQNLSQFKLPGQKDK